MAKRGKIILTPKNFNHLQKNSYVQKHGLRCYKCLKSFQLGDQIITLYGGGHKRAKWYCKNCAIQLYIIKSRFIK